MLTILWDVDSRDYTRPGAGIIARRVLGQARSGSIVLMHDAAGNRSQTLAAQPSIIDVLKRRGYELVTVPTCSISNCARRATSGRPRKYAPFRRPPITAWSHPATGHVPQAHSRIAVRPQASPATTGDGTYFRGRPLGAR